MSTLEMALKMMAEATMTELTRIWNPQGLAENQDIAKRVGCVSGGARKAIEKDSGRSVITSENAARLNTAATTMVEDMAQAAEKEEIEEK